MFIDQAGRRINIHASYVKDNVRYGNLLDPSDREKVGVTFIPDVEPPEGYQEHPEYFQHISTNWPPYDEYVQRPISEIEEIVLKRAKEARADIVNSIIVTTASGKQFDAHEDAQNRMARAVVGLEDNETTGWVLADNTIAVVTKEELREALRLAGAAQTQAWVAPYIQS